MRRQYDDMAGEVRKAVSREAMKSVTAFLERHLADRVDSLIAAQDAHSLVRAQGAVRGMQEAVRLLEKIYEERR